MGAQEEAERAYLAAREGIGAQPLDQEEADRLAGLWSNLKARRFERAALECLRGYFAEDDGDGSVASRSRAFQGCAFGCTGRFRKVPTSGGGS